MQRVFLRLFTVTAALGFAALPLRADNRPAPKGPDEDGTKPALARIAGEGIMNSHAFSFLTELSDDIGGRVTGTPAERKAEEWGAAKMKAIGLENVRTEKYTIWRGWARGTAEGEILAPVRHKLHVDAMGWTGSTPTGGAEGDVVAVNMFDIENEIKNVSRLKGKIVLVTAKGKPTKDEMSLFAMFGDFLKAAGPAGAVAVIGGQGGGKSTGMNLTHTGILGFNADFAVPVVSMSAEDQGQLERFLERGMTPRVRFNVQNTFTKGSGAAAALGAADAIVRSGQRPRRTIRFVLFTGEEEGLDGSFAYMKQHQGEIKNHLGSLVIDGGQGPAKSFHLGGRDDLVPGFQAFANSLSNLGASEVDDRVESGTDTLPFSMAGLPGIDMGQDSPDYKYTHHSAADALEAQKPDVLAQNATLMALAAFWIADRPERFASPWPAERTARMLRAQHEYEELKAFNLWPYGDLGAEEKKDNPQK